MMSKCIKLAITLGWALTCVDSRTLRVESSFRLTKPHPPPEPIGKAPEKDKDGAYKDKTDACAACKFAATGSCAMYNTCTCYAVNTVFKSDGVFQPSDKDNWRWACGAEGGEKYVKCFDDTATNTDSFGEEVDTTKPKCPL